jgi:F0F1-type ATP synthase assembly protein I
MPLVPGDRRGVGQAMLLAQVPLEMMSLLVLGLLGDHFLGTTPWLSVSGAVLSFVGGMAHLVLIINRMNKDSSSGPPRESS